MAAIEGLGVEWGVVDDCYFSDEVEDASGLGEVEDGVVFVEGLDSEYEI